MNRPAHATIKPATRLPGETLHVRRFRHPIADQHQLGARHTVSFGHESVVQVGDWRHGTIQFWDAQTGELARTLNQGEMIRDVVFSRCGRQLASLGADGVVKVWDWDSDRVADPSWTPEARPLAVRAHVPGPSSIIDFSPDGRLAVGAENSTVLIWDVQSDRLLQTLRGHSDDLYAVAFCPTGSSAMSGSDYVATSGTIYFEPGETSKMITVTIKGDTKKENDERFYVNLSGAIGASLADSRGEGTILNDDGGGTKRKSKSVQLAAPLDTEDTLIKARKRR